MTTSIKFIRVYQSTVAQAGIPQYRIECSYPGFPQMLGYVTKDGKEWRADATAALGGLKGVAATRYDATQAMIRAIEKSRDDATRAALAGVL